MIFVNNNIHRYLSVFKPVNNTNCIDTNLPSDAKGSNFIIVRVLWLLNSTLGPICPSVIIIYSILTVDFPAVSIRQLFKEIDCLPTTYFYQSYALRCRDNDTQKHKYRFLKKLRKQSNRKE